MKSILFVVALICLLSSAQLVSAFMPNTHYYIFEQALKNPTTSELYSSCIRNPSLCYIGDELVDISVIFYYTQSNKYEATHSPSFCRALIQNAQNDQEYSCAVGGCIHQPTDLPSHTILVPEVIRRTFIPNSIIHVFAEQKVDNVIVSENPDIKGKVINSLSDYKVCQPLFVRTMLGDSNYADMSENQINELFDKFITEIQNSKTGYDTAFKTKSFFVNVKSVPLPIMAIFVFVMLSFLFISILTLIRMIGGVNGHRRIRDFLGFFFFTPLFFVMAFLFVGNLFGSAFNNFITVITPVSNLVPVGDSHLYTDQAISNIKQMFSQGESWLSGTESSGFTQLTQADKSVQIISYVIFSILIISLLLFMWFVIKKSRKKA